MCSILIHSITLIYSLLLFWRTATRQPLSVTLRAVCKNEIMCNYYWHQISQHEVKQSLHSVMKVMMKIWVPCPRNTDSNMPFLGGRNTSPCTCFHPDSSCASSWGGREPDSNTAAVTIKEVLDIYKL